MELLIHVTGFDVIVQENEMLKDINNLHKQTTIFKEALKN